MTAQLDALRKRAADKEAALQVRVAVALLLATALACWDPGCCALAVCYHPVTSELDPRLDGCVAITLHPPTPHACRRQLSSSPPSWPARWLTCAASCSSTSPVCSSSSPAAQQHSRQLRRPSAEHRRMQPLLCTLRRRMRSRRASSVSSCRSRPSRRQHRWAWVGPGLQASEAQLTCYCSRLATCKPVVLSARRIAFLIRPPPQPAAVYIHCVVHSSCNLDHPDHHHVPLNCPRPQQPRKRCRHNSKPSSSSMPWTWQSSSSGCSRRRQMQQPRPA